jgi:beta-lactamase regulating signal transducer with metallopeptidase domain
MSLPYTMRLLCLCGASFFMIHMTLALAARLSAATAVRWAEHMKPSSAARFLFILRMSPLALTLTAMGFCVSSYLWLEPEVSGEEVGFVCVLLAVLGFALWTSAIRRVLGAIRGTSRYLHECERRGRKIAVPGENSPALLVTDKNPVMAVAGVFRPQLLISRRVMSGLSPEQREAALRHEHAHLSSGDNLKRLLILLAPDAIPFGSAFGPLERAWSRFTEWSADDQATDGDPQRALTLASALVRVAKMGSGRRPTYLSCSLVGGTKDLSERVERLLRPQPKPDKPIKELISLLSGAGGLVATAVAIMVIWPGSLAVVHQALERLIH